jgi:hypothetical protein
VSVLATPAGPAFLIADPVAAAGLIVLEGCERLRKAGFLAPKYARDIAAAIARNDAPSNRLAVELLGTHALSQLLDRGAPPLVALLCPSDVDGGPASTLRFTHAIDVLAATVDADLTDMPDVIAYGNSIRRTLADLESLRAILKPRGTIHSLAAGITGAHAVPAANMVHLDSGITLLPAFGGVCARLDAANQAILGAVGRQARLIPSSESATRQGASRCSVVLLG